MSWAQSSSQGTADCAKYVLAIKENCQNMVRGFRLHVGNVGPKDRRPRTPCVLPSRPNLDESSFPASLRARWSVQPFGSHAKSEASSGDPSPASRAKTYPG